MRPDSPTFAELGVRPEIVAALAEAGIERTFAIQELTLPLALAGDDLIGQARTGMGKTLGFGVPLLQRVTPPSEQPAANADGEAADRTKDVPQALVVVPTRELCVQVAKDLADAGAKLGVRVTAIYGGRAYEPQIAALRKGVDVVVGTPGRLLDLAEQRHLVLGRVKALVLDEADEMLDLGFLPDIERIMRMVPEQRQTMLFSATMPGPILTLSRAFLNQPDAHPGGGGRRGLDPRAHHAVRLPRARDGQGRDARPRAAGQGPRPDHGLRPDQAHRAAGRRRPRRARVRRRRRARRPGPGRPRAGAARVPLRARSTCWWPPTSPPAASTSTDVTHVVNYQCPEDDKTYVHRIGRTGRAGKTGVAVTLVDWDELHRWKTISDDLGLDMPEPPETYSTSAHLYSDLDIPETPRAACRLRSAPGRAWTPSTSTPRATTAGAAGSHRDRQRSPRRRDEVASAPPAPRPSARSRGGVLLGSDGAPVDGRADRRRIERRDRGAGARRGHRSGRRRRRDHAAPPSPSGWHPSPARWPVTPAPRLRRRPTRPRTPRRAEARPLDQRLRYTRGVVLRLQRPAAPGPAAGRLDQDVC